MAKLVYAMEPPGMISEDDATRIFTRHTPAQCEKLRRGLETVRTLPPDQREEATHDQMARFAFDTTSHPEPMFGVLPRAYGSGWVLQDTYSGNLIAMKEPKLTAETPGDVLRVFWAPSFLPAVSIRIVREVSGIRLIARSVDRSNVVLRDETKPVTELEWGELEKLLSRLSWQPEMPERHGSDGERFIVERVHAGAYQTEMRWSPLDEPSQSDFNALVRRVAELGGVKL